MANVSLKDATKVLVEEASGILEEATRIRKQADSLFDTLKRMDAEMNRQAEEEAARRRQQEQLKAQSAHTKAFTMLDEDEKQMMEAARQEEATKETAEKAAHIRAEFSTFKSMDAIQLAAAKMNGCDVFLRAEGIKI